MSTTSVVWHTNLLLASHLTTYHIAVSIGTSIVIVERLYPSHRDTPWTGRLGLAIAGAVFAILVPLGSAEFHVPPIPVLIAASALCLALIAAAFLALDVVIGLGGRYDLSICAILAGIALSRLHARVSTHPSQDHLPRHQPILRNQRRRTITEQRRQHHPMERPRRQRLGPIHIRMRIQPQHRELIAIPLPRRRDRRQIHPTVPSNRHRRPPHSQPAPPAPTQHSQPPHQAPSPLPKPPVSPPPLALPAPPQPPTEPPPPSHRRARPLPLPNLQHRHHPRIKTRPNFTSRSNSEGE